MGKYPLLRVSVTWTVNIHIISFNRGMDRRIKLSDGWQFEGGICLFSIFFFGYCKILQFQGGVFPIYSQINSKGIFLVSSF